MLFNKRNLFFYLFFGFLIQINYSQEIQLSKNVRMHKNPEKRNWLIMIYMVTGEDLQYFIDQNFKQIKASGNNNSYIVAQINEPGKKTETKRIIITGKGQDQIISDPDLQGKFDSGNAQTLIDFCTTCIKNCPAENYMLCLVNHGSGILDGEKMRVRRKNPFGMPIRNRGICFDDSFGSYIDNEELDYALNTICNEATKILNLKENFKFQILGMDACLMQMIEIGYYLKKYAHIMVASEEVIYGPGWYYNMAFEPLNKNSMDYISFANHLVNAYGEAYKDFQYRDYTLSAINLDLIENIENNINKVSEILIKIFEGCTNPKELKKILKSSKMGINFQDPNSSYIDLLKFFENLLFYSTNKKFNFEFDSSLKNSLEENLKEGINLINKSVINKVVGTDLTFANGIAIYFPEKKIFDVYSKTSFAKNSKWLNFLSKYMEIELEKNWWFF